MTDQTRRIIPIVQTTQAPELKPANELPVGTSLDPHVKLAEIFMATHGPAEPSRKQRNLTEVAYTAETTRKNRVALIVVPEWSPLAPPYGMARMSAISKAMGFETRCWDINIQTRHEAGCSEYWTAYEDWKWTEPHYSENIHPKIESVLLKYVEQVVAYAPSVIGLSTWVTNDTCTLWVIRQFRQRLPQAKIVVGGPNATQMWQTQTQKEADHVVVGEGELWWVKILEHYENPGEPLPHLCVQSKDQRVDLDSMPPADYSDFDISLYESGGISCEFSRGCIANCVYCNETVFWKFRARQSSAVIEEIEIAYRQKGIRAVWFIDSLLNGNLRELRNFAEELIRRDIKISWTGYSRIDGKMDREFWQLLKQSGASGFAFGVESGSQKVLGLMKKNCKVEHIEQNFRDLYAINSLNNFATWFTGFPGEELTDLAQTMTLMWRLRESGMGSQSSGTCGLGINTPLDLERERFGVAKQDWSWGWCTQDMRNTVFHRFIRFKSANILLEQFRLHAMSKPWHNTHRQYPDLANQYTLQSDPANWRAMIPWEKEFDYEIIKVDINPVANSLVNEMWPLLRVLWLAMGAYKFTLNFEPERDLREFGYIRYPRGGEHRFWGDYAFEIDANGRWSADFDIKMQADPYNDQPTDFHFQWQHSDHWDRPLEISQ